MNNNFLGIFAIYELACYTNISVFQTISHHSAKINKQAVVGGLFYFDHNAILPDRIFIIFGLG